jgi:hypothetical protein
MTGSMTAKRTLLAGAICVIASSAAAQTPKLIKTYSDWTLYTYSSTKGKVCFALATPTSQRPTGVNRDPTYFMVTTRPSEQVRDEVSVEIGYPFKTGSHATVSVDGEKFRLFTQADGAWIDELSDERQLVDAMRAGAKMSVHGLSRRGTHTTDTYSLMGVSAALNAAGNACS